MAGEGAFRENHERYDNWFHENKELYELELKAVKQFIPENKKGLEIGVGTGKFAVPLNIKFGCDPVFEMFSKSKKAGINIVCSRGEALPFKDDSFDFALSVTSLCFFDDVVTSFREAKRVIKKNGSFILGFVDKDSWLGNIYLKKKDKNPFYKDAFFYSAKEVRELLSLTGFRKIESFQTIFENNLKDISTGYGKGGFAVIRGIS